MLRGRGMGLALNLNPKLSEKKGYYPGIADAPFHAVVPRVAREEGVQSLPAVGVTAAPSGDAIIRQVVPGVRYDGVTVQGSRLWGLRGAVFEASVVTQHAEVIGRAVGVPLAVHPDGDGVLLDIRVFVAYFSEFAGQFDLDGALELEAIFLRTVC